MNIVADVNFTKCPPAYTLNENSSCTCNKDHFFGIVACSNQPSGEQTTTIVSGVWAGYMDNEFVTAPCSFVMCHLNGKVETPLPTNISITQENNDSLYSDIVCANNRRGMLCSIVQEVIQCTIILTLILVKMQPNASLDGSFSSCQTWSH